MPSKYFVLESKFIPHPGQFFVGWEEIQNKQIEATCTHILKPNGRVTARGSSKIPRLLKAKHKQNHMPPCDKPQL